MKNNQTPAIMDQRPTPSTTPPTNATIRVLFWNAMGLTKRVEELGKLSDLYRPDFIVVLETCYPSSVLMETFMLGEQKYKCLHSTRATSLSKGGITQFSLEKYTMKLKFNKTLVNRGHLLSGFLPEIEYWVTGIYNPLNKFFPQLLEDLRPWASAVGKGCAASDFNINLFLKNKTCL